MRDLLLLHADDDERNQFLKNQRNHQTNKKPTEGQPENLEVYSVPLDYNNPSFEFAKLYKDFAHNKMWPHMNIVNNEFSNLNNAHFYEDGENEFSPE